MADKAITRKRIHENTRNVLLANFFNDFTKIVIIFAYLILMVNLVKIYEFFCNRPNLKYNKKWNSWRIIREFLGNFYA